MDASALSASRNELAGVHDSLRIERLLDRPQRAEPRRIAEPGELVELHLADAMLGRDRAAGRGDEVVDQGADRRRPRPRPTRRPRPTGARTLKWTLPSPRWPKALTRCPGIARLDFARGLDRRSAAMSRDRRPRCRAWRRGRPSSRPRRSSRAAARSASACASLAAITASATSPVSSAERSAS